MHLLRIHLGALALGAVPSVAALAAAHMTGTPLLSFLAIALLAAPPMYVSLLLENAWIQGAVNEHDPKLDDGSLALLAAFLNGSLRPSVFRLKSIETLLRGGLIRIERRRLLPNEKAVPRLVMRMSKVEALQSHGAVNGALAARAFRKALDRGSADILSKYARNVMPHASGVSAHKMMELSLRIGDPDLVPEPDDFRRFSLEMSRKSIGWAVVVKEASGHRMTLAMCAEPDVPDFVWVERVEAESASRGTA